jgi:hypothetical protein
MNAIWSDLKLLRRIWLLGAFFASVTLSLPQELKAAQTPPDKTEPAHGSLSLRILPKGTTFHPGQTMRLRVELRNTGHETIFVRKDIDLSPCARGSLRIFSLKGSAFPGPDEGCATDCWTPLLKDSKLSPIASVVIRDWVPLPPGYTYSREIESQALGKPGRYLIGGDYTSTTLGVDCEGDYSAEELAKLPYPLWTGRVETNSIWIEVTKR